MRPREYANILIEQLASREEKPIVLGTDQLKFVTLIVSKLEALLDRGPGEKMEQTVILLHGQGGSGKTEVVDIARKLVRYFGYGEKAAAYSNSAARVIGGDTINSLAHMNAMMKLGADTLENGITPNLVEAWQDVALLVVDEI